jgi:hypothetical protein
MIRRKESRVAPVVIPRKSIYPSRPHEWVLSHSVSREMDIFKCKTCGVLCVIEPDMPNRRWNHDEFPRRRIPVADCDEILTSQVMDS